LAEPITAPLYAHGPAARPTASDRPSSICRPWWDAHASKPAAHHENPSSSTLFPVHTQQQPSEQAMAALRLGLDAASQPCCVLARGALPEMRGVVGSVATAWAPHGGRRWRSWPPPHSLTAAKVAAATSQATAGSSPTQLDSRQWHHASARRQRNYRSRLAADVRVRKCEPVRPRLVGRLHIEGHVLTKRCISFANYTFYISLAINSLST